MFTIDSTITDLRVKEQSIAKLSFSMNSPHIATPELSTEAARCYILIFKEGGRYRAHIGLYLPASDRKFYYSYSDNPFGEDALDLVIDEATVFTEGMGFMLDELNIGTMSSDERNHWFESQDIFGYRKRPEPKTTEPETAPAAVSAAPVQAEAVPSAAPPAQTAPIAPQVPPAATAAPVAPAPIPAATFTVAPVAPVTIPAAVAPAAEPVVIPILPVPPPPQPEARAEQEETEDEMQPPPAKPKQRGKAALTRTAPAMRRPAAMADEEEEQEVATTLTSPKRPARPAMKTQVDQRSGTVSREYEALVRLLASF